MWSLDSLLRRPACRPADWQVNSEPESRRACADSANASHPAWCISQCRRICSPRTLRPPGPMLAGHFSSIPARPQDILVESGCFLDNRRCNPPFPSLRNFRIFMIILDHYVQHHYLQECYKTHSHKLCILIYKLLINFFMYLKMTIYKNWIIYTVTNVHTK